MERGINLFNEYVSDLEEISDNFERISYIYKKLPTLIGKYFSIISEDSKIRDEIYSKLDEISKIYFRSYGELKMKKLGKQFLIDSND